MVQKSLKFSVVLVEKILTLLIYINVEMRECNREAMQIPSLAFCHCIGFVGGIKSVLQFGSVLFG
jgi:hypothetical protein